MGFGVRYDEINFIQSVASTTWNITHNLNTTAPVVDCWIDDGFGNKAKTIPQFVTVVDENTVTITFNTAQSGEALVV